MHEDVCIPRVTVAPDFAQLRGAGYMATAATCCHPATGDPYEVCILTCREPRPAAVAVRESGV